MKRHLGVIAILVGVTLLAYSNSFQVPLIFDDLETIQRNTSVRFGDWAGTLFSARGLLYLTFMANFQWSGLEVWSYHVVNFVLHVLNGILVYFIGLRIFEFK